MINADDIAGLNLRDPFIESYATVTRTAKPVFTYAEYAPKDGDAAFVAEGGLKPEIDLAITVKTVGPKKVAAYEVMSEEALTDIPRMDSESKNLLLKKVILKRQSKILFGDGTSDTPIGVASLARAFSAASWTGDKVTDVNLYDVIVALANQIYTTYNYTDEASYYPNLGVMNPSDIASLKLKKNEFGMYLFPQFQLVGSRGQSINVDGITILPQRDIAAGKIMMGDFSKLRIVNYIDYQVKLGWINDQLIYNLFTMVGESRFFTIIKNLDRNAFIYDDISDVVNGIKAV
jgi:HK97 family phage major capsid protein